MKISKLICALALVATSTNTIFAQEQKKDEKKIQEVITMTADPVQLPPNPDGSVPVDTSGPKPMAQSEILKRAVYFVKLESKKYSKTNGVTTGSKAECIAVFNYKPKELNPQADVQGTITMHVSIEAKEGKYRYTISKLNHSAKNATYTGGDVNSEVPKCGSMKMPNDVWKRLKSEAYKNAAVVADDLKELMKRPSTAKSDEDEW